jgi:adenylosuccinate synthase
MAITKVFMICCAYESGVGHGFEMDGLPNPYLPNTDEHEAYEYGYSEGIDKRMGEMDDETK